MYQCHVSISEYCRKFDYLYSKIKRNGSKFSEYILAHKLLTSACLTKQDETLIRLTVAEMSYNAVMFQLRKVFSGITSFKIKHEHHSVRDQTDDLSACSVSYSPGNEEAENTSSCTESECNMGLIVKPTKTRTLVLNDSAAEVESDKAHHTQSTLIADNNFNIVYKDYSQGDIVDMSNEVHHTREEMEMEHAPDQEGCFNSSSGIYELKDISEIVERKLGRPRTCKPTKPVLIRNDEVEDQLLGTQQVRTDALVIQTTDTKDPNPHNSDCIITSSEGCNKVEDFHKVEQEGNVLQAEKESSKAYINLEKPGFSKKGQVCTGEEDHNEASYISRKSGMKQSSKEKNLIIVDKQKQKWHKRKKKKQSLLTDKQTGKCQKRRAKEPLSRKDLSGKWKYGKEENDVNDDLSPEDCTAVDVEHELVVPTEPEHLTEISDEAVTEIQGRDCGIILPEIKVGDGSNNITIGIKYRNLKKRPQSKKSKKRTRYMKLEKQSWRRRRRKMLIYIKRD